MQTVERSKNFELQQKINSKSFKKVLTKEKTFDIISNVKRQMNEKKFYITNKVI